MHTKTTSTTEHDTFRGACRRSLRLLGAASVLVGAVSVFSLGGCNTLEGAGKDIEAAGDGIQDAAND